MNEQQKTIKITILSSHPTQHEGPMLRNINKHPLIDLNVYFYSNPNDLQIKKRRDPEVGYLPNWDIPILEGYKYKFISCLTIKGYINDLLNKDYDIIVIEGYNSLYSWLTMIIARAIRRIPVIFRCDSTLLYKNTIFKSLVKKLILKIVCYISSAYLYVGSLNKKFYRYYNIPLEKLFLVPYAVDNEFIKKRCDTFRKKKNRYRNQYGIPKDIIVILGILKFIEREAPMDLLKAYTILDRKGIKAALVLVGDGKQRILIEEYIKQNKLNNVYLVGYREYSELPKFYAIADIFVHPVIRGSWELSINEATAAGLPVITTDLVGSAQDLIKEGVNGFIYHAGDIEELAAKLEIILNNRNLMIKMGQESQKIILPWSYKQCTKGFIESVKYITKRKEKHINYPY